MICRSLTEFADDIFERHETLVDLIGLFLLGQGRVRLFYSLRACKIDKRDLGCRLSVCVVVKGIDYD